MFRSFKVAHRIAFLLLFFLGVTFVVGFYSYSLFQSLDDQIVEINQEIVPLKDSLARILSAQYKVSVYAERTARFGRDTFALAKKNNDDDWDDDWDDEEEDTKAVKKDLESFSQYKDMRQEYERVNQLLQTEYQALAAQLNDLVLSTHNPDKLKKLEHFQSMLKEAQNEFNYLSENAKKTFDFYDNDQYKSAQEYAIYLQRESSEMDAGMKSMFEEVDRYLVQKIAFLDKQKSSVKYIIAWVAFVGIVVGLAFSIFIIYRIVNPLRKASLVAEQLAQGDADIHVSVTGRDEISQVFASMRRMANTLQDITNVAIEVSDGDYGRTVEIKSEKDLLAKSINRMSKHLSDVSETERKKNWIKTGQTQLSDSMRGEQEINQLAKKIITYIAKYLEAQVGVFYIADDKNVLHMMGSYAYKQRKQLDNQIKFGDGIVGQAALEKEMILLSDVPDEYTMVNSGIGNAQARYILVMPILLEDIVKGVLEVGSLHPFNETHLEFMDSVSGSIAIAINSAEAREQMKRLLDEYQRQSEKLQQQQEELRAANEEMAEQTRMLRISEEQAKIQSEKLGRVNGELEEKTRVLEKQKEEIQKRNAEIELAKLDIEEKVRQLEQSSQYKSQFLANMSHELRTPLNSLIILANILFENEEENLTEDQLDSIQVIKNGGEELLSLINDILDLSKVEAGKLSVIIEDVSLNTLCEDIKNQFAPLARQKNIELHVTQGGDVRNNLRTDGQRVRQIIKNLLSNAFKFTERGKVCFDVSRPKDAIVFMTKTLTHNNCVALAVKDSGIGIPKEKQKAIFDAFQQVDGSTSRKYGGTGLGLTISRELARLLGGEVHLESIENEGATFTLYLPFEAPISENATVVESGFSEEQSQQTAAYNETVGKTSDATADKVEALPVPASSEAVTSVAHTIANVTSKAAQSDDIARPALLVVEDDEHFSTILKGLAVKKDFIVHVANTGTEALRIAQQENLDGVILDLGLPDIDGMKILEQLKDNPKTQKVPVHIISGRDVSFSSFENAASGFLAKPASMDDIECVFNKIEQSFRENINRVLVIESDKNSSQAIRHLLAHEQANTTTVMTGKDALEALKDDYDCVILDIELPDISGFELLKQADERDDIHLPPVIVYTARELTREEYNQLSRYTRTTIVKGADNADRLLDEISLFLHSVNKVAVGPKPVKKPSQAKPAVPPEGSKVLSGRKILLVDDDMRNIFALSKVLNKQDMVVEMADNGELAIEKLEKDVENSIELVIMDIMMPVMDGYEAIKRIRTNKRFDKLPIIALTAKAMTGDREKCMEAGANDYLTKPVNIEKLVGMLRVWLYQDNDKN